MAWLLLLLTLWALVACLRGWMREHRELAEAKRVWNDLLLPLQQREDFILEKLHECEGTQGVSK